MVFRINFMSLVFKLFLPQITLINAEKIGNIMRYMKGTIVEPILWGF